MNRRSGRSTRVGLGIEAGPSSINWPLVKAKVVDEGLLVTSAFIGLVSGSQLERVSRRSALLRTARVSSVRRTGALVQWGAILRTSDGSASGVAVWDLLVKIARADRLTIMPVGCATCIVDEAARGDLPSGIPEPIEVIRTGADLLRVIQVP